MSTDFSFKTKKAEITEKAEKIIDDFVAKKKEEKANQIKEILAKQNVNYIPNDSSDNDIFTDPSTDDLKGWSSQISYKLISELSAQYKTVKIISFCSILEAGEVEMFYESRSIWNPNTDGCIQIKRENTRPRIFASIYILCP